MPLLLFVTLNHTPSVPVLPTLAWGCRAQVTTGFLRAKFALVHSPLQSGLTTCLRWLRLDFFKALPAFKSTPDLGRLRHCHQYELTVFLLSSTLFPKCP